MFALTRAPQIEVGLRGDQLSDSFGPTTMSLLPANSGISARVSAVLEMRRDMGFIDGRMTLSPKEFKALLTMDAYVIVENGSATIRSVQQWMNQTYYAE